MTNWTSKIKDKLVELEGDVGHYVYELAPIIENKKEVYQLASSTQTGLMNQMSLFLAMREYHENKDTIFSWKKFEESFEKCFPEILLKSPHWGTAQNPWGKPFSNRPRFKVFYPTDEESRDKENSKLLWLVEFWPDREEKENSHLLLGNLNNIISQAIQIMHWLKCADGLNNVLGMPVTEHLKRAPKISLTIELVFSNYKNPPWYKSESRPDYVEHRISIPFVRPSIIKDYQQARTICGGSNGLDWGREKATAYVALSSDDYPSNKKGMPQVWTGGADYNKAKQNAKQLLALSDCKIISFGKSGKDYDEGVESTRPASDKPSVSYKVYPNKFWIENTRIVEAGSSSTSTPARKVLLGKMNKKSNKFRLDYSSEPYGYTEAINSLIRWDND